MSTSCQQWLALHAKRLQQQSLSDLFNQDPTRFAQFSETFETLTVDYSKHCIDQATMTALMATARHAELELWRDRLFAGEAINHTEQRAVLHMALRADKQASFKVGTQSVMADVEQTRQRLYSFAEGVRNGQWRGATGERITTIVNIGIGGSDLGPKFICDALQSYSDLESPLKLLFLSRLDATHLHDILSQCDAARTLFIVASKTFTTLETMDNAHAARAWLVDLLGEAAVAKHFVAVSTHLTAVAQFGIAQENIFGFWDWVGGRYSLWSAIGLPILIAVGQTHFEALLAGAQAMDVHFQHTPLENNLPVIMGLLGYWYRGFFDAQSHAVLCYDERLRYFPDYLQQLDMESNGKQVNRKGQVVQGNTGPIVWGGLGNSGQHAFYQLLHQGTSLVPVDFLAPIQPDITPPTGTTHHAKLLANCLAQSAALMKGKSAKEAQIDLEKQGLTDTQIAQLLPYKIFPGNRPSSTLLYDKLTPRVLGSLIALYEHKVFVQGILWQINSFDQWGVELGKQLANQLIPLLLHPQQQHDTHTLDASTVGLLERIAHSQSL